MPNRIIKESINESKSLSECSFFTQDLYKRLITYADDYGRFNVDPAIMLARLYPRDMDIITADVLNEAITELVGVEKVDIYRCKVRPDDLFAVFPNWREHQRLRNSKPKCPEPEEYVNGWFLKRFVPISLKVAVVEQQGGRCASCNKAILLQGVTAKAAVKMHTGALYFDHAVPTIQGEAPALENVRAICPKCFLAKHKVTTVSDILLELAASCGELQPHARVYENPIESNPIESEIESNKKGNRTDKPSHSKTIPPKVEEVSAYCQERCNGIDPQHFIDFYTAKGWMIGKEKMKDWKAAVRTWEKREANNGKPASDLNGKSADEKWGIRGAITVGD